VRKLPQSLVKVATGDSQAYHTSRFAHSKFVFDSRTRSAWLDSAAKMDRSPARHALTISVSMTIWVTRSIDSFVREFVELRGTRMSLSFPMRACAWAEATDLTKRLGQNDIHWWPTIVSRFMLQQTACNLAL
jgi:hypothetical protein